LIKLNT